MAPLTKPPLSSGANEVNFYSKPDSKQGPKAHPA